MAAETLLDLALLPLILLVAAAIGLRTLRWARVAPSVDPSVLLLSVGIGLGAIAYCVLLIGALGLLFPWLLLAFLAIVALLARHELMDVARAVAAVRPAWPTQRFEALLLALLIAFLSLGFLSTLGPAVDYDAQMYHLAAPRLYAGAHRILWLTENTHASFPATVEMLYTFGLVFGTDQFARMLNFAFGALTALGLYRYVSHRFGREPALLATLIFLSIPLVANAEGRAGVDLGLTFFAFLAILALVKWLTRPSTSWLVLSGVCAGLAAGTKYTGLQLLAIMVLTLALALLPRGERSPRRWVATLGLPLAAGLIVAAPWYVKNLLLFGNPVYPVYFGGRGWTDGQLQLLHDSFAGFGFGHDAAAYLALLPNMILHPGRFTLDPPGLASALLLLTPFVWLTHRADAAVRRLLIICLLQFAWWSAGMQESRFLLPILPWLSVLSALVLWRCMQTPRPLIRATAHTIGILAVIPLLYWQIQRASLDGLRVVAGLESRRDYIARRFDEYPSIEHANAHLPPDAKLLLLWRNRGYYLERAYVPDDFYTRFGALVEEEGSPAKVYAAMRRMGVTHVLVNAVDPPLWEADAGSLFHQDARRFAAFKQEYLAPLYRDGRNELLVLEGN